MSFHLPPIIYEGQRNDVLCRYAGSRRRRGLEEPDLADELLETNRERCRPPLDIREVRAIARSVAKYQPARARYRITRAAILAATPGSVRRLTRSRFIVTGRRCGRFDVDLDGDGGATCSCGRSMTPNGSSCTHTRAARIWVRTAYPLEGGDRLSL
jgi:hypothetical protein